MTDFYLTLDTKNAMKNEEGTYIFENLSQTKKFDPNKCWKVAMVHAMLPGVHALAGNCYMEIGQFDTVGNLIKKQSYKVESWSESYNVTQFKNMLNHYFQFDPIFSKAFLQRFGASAYMRLIYDSNGRKFTVEIKETASLNYAIRFTGLLATKLGFVDQSWLKPRVLGAVQRFMAPEPHLIAMGTQVVLISIDGLEDEPAPGSHEGSRLPLLAMVNTAVVKSSTSTEGAFSYGYDGYLDFPISRPLYKDFSKTNLRSIRLRLLNQYQEPIKFQHQPYLPTLITLHIKEKIACN